MNFLRTISLSLLLLLSACTSYDGVYSPACIAFAGDEVELDNGRIRWDKFTDQVVIGEDGEAVDPFPDYPMQGSYSIDGGRLTIESDPGMPADTMFLLRHEGKTALLTPEQHADWQRTGELPECALVLGGRSGN